MSQREASRVGAPAGWRFAATHTSGRDQSWRTITVDSSLRARCRRSSATNRNTQTETHKQKQESECEAMMYSGSGYGTAMVFSILAIAAGAVMYWAITAPAHGFRVSTVGVVLM